MDEFDLPRDATTAVAAAPAVPDGSMIAADMAEEDATQAFFLEHAALSFVGRKAQLARLQEFVESDVQRYPAPSQRAGRSFLPD